MSEPTIVNDAASNPQRVRTAAGEVFNYSLYEKIAAEKYLKAKSAQANPFLCLRMGAFISPNAHGDHGANGTT